MKSAAATRITNSTHEGDVASATRKMSNHTLQGAKTPTGVNEVRFVRPIPGFPDMTRFKLDRLGDEDNILWELNSIERPEIRFMVATAYGFFPEYDVELDDDICEDLSLSDAADALILVVLTVTPEKAEVTANLLAPIVINARSREAAQVILSGSDWPVRAPLG